MTNTLNSGLGWEVAGGKKNTLRNNKVTTLNSAESNSSKQTNGGKNALSSSSSKIPKLVTSPPLKSDGTIYDAIRESDDDDYDSNDDNTAKKKTTKSKVNTQSAPVSPKQVQQQQQQNNKGQETINLLKTSMLTSQKKSPKPVTSHRKIETELEQALAEMSFESIQNEYSQLEKLYPESYATIVFNMAKFLNSILNHIPDLETNVCEPILSKLDKKVEKFLNNLINKLKKTESDLVFRDCFNIIFTDSPKILSHHGFVLFIQLLLRSNPNSINLNQCLEVINANKHKHQRVLIALRSLSQIGLSNLNEGIKTWFDVMLPMITIKSLSNYIVLNLNFLFEYHKANVSKLNSSQTLIDCDQYLKLYDLINEKTLSSSYSLSKESSQKLKSTFEIIKEIFYQNLSRNSEYFEPILANLTADANSPRQSELLNILTKILFSNKNSLATWRQIYSKTLLQSTIFLDHLDKNHSNSLRNYRELRDVLAYFDKQTSAQLLTKEPVKETSLTSAAAAAAVTSKTNYYGKKVPKSSAQTLENERLKSFNKLSKQLIKQNFQKASFLTMAFRSFLIIGLLLSGFFYWDINQNKSINVNLIQNQLQKYGLLEKTQQIIETFNKLMFDAKKYIEQNVPIWYKKTMTTLTPYVNRVSNLTIEYSTLAWTKSEPYRDLASVYYEQSRKYIEINLPIVINKSLTYLELVIENSIKAFDTCMVYVNQAVDFTETKLGLEKGEFDRIFLDAYQILKQKVNTGMNWLYKNLMTNIY